MSSQDINNAVKMAAYCALFSNDIYDSKKLVVTPTPWTPSWVYGT